MGNDKNKTKEQLIAELESLRKLNAELSAVESNRGQVSGGIPVKDEMSLAQKYFDIAGVIIVAIDADQKVTLINKKGCEILSCMEEDVIGHNWFDNFIPVRIRDEVKKVFNKLMAGDLDPAVFFENPVITRKGEERIIAWHNTLLREEPRSNWPGSSLPTLL